MKTIKKVTALLLALFLMITLYYSPLSAKADSQDQDEEVLYISEEEIERFEKNHQMDQSNQEIIEPSVNLEENDIESCDDDHEIYTTDVPFTVENITTDNKNGSNNETKGDNIEHEIVLVLDVSGSMRGSPMTQLKKACLNFVNDMLNEDPNARIAIVKYASGVTEVNFDGEFFTSDLNALKKAIDSLRDGGGTAMNAGLAKADELLFKYGKANKQFIIQMADGEPNEGSGYYGADAKFSNGYESEVYKTYESINANADYNVISLGFFHSMSGSQKEEAGKFMSSIQNSGYIEVSNGDELQFSFDNISNYISQRAMILSKNYLTIYPGLCDRLTVRFTSAFKSADKTIKWESSDSKIAKVDKNGVVTAINEGKCKITASAGAYDSICNVLVTKEPNKKPTNQLITVYENKNNPDDDEENNVLSDNAVITYNNVDYKTDKKGTVTVPLDNTGEITVRKDGYRQRIISVSKLNAMGKKVYLQKESDNPLIESVYINNNDVLSNEISISLTSTASTRLTAEVDWGKSSYNRIRLTQQNKSIDFNNNTLDIVLAQQFDISKAIYIVATDAAGHSSKRKIKVVPSDKLEGLSGMKIDAGKASLTLPDSLPKPIGGSEFSLNLDSLTDKIPISVSYDNGKVKAVLGIAGLEHTYKNESETDKKTGKTKTTKQGSKTEIDVLSHQIKEIHNTLDKEKDKNKDESLSSELKKSLSDLKDIKNKYKDQIAKPKSKFGFDADIQVLGYVEGYVGDGKFHFTEGGIIIVPEVSANWNWQLGIGPVPIYIEAGISAKLEAALSIAKKADRFQFTATIKFTLSGNLGAGVGVADVVSAGGGGKLTIKPEIYLYYADPTYMSLAIDFNFYVKAKLLFFDWQYDFDTIHLAKWDNSEQIKNKNKKASLNRANEALTDISNYKVEPLSYISEDLKDSGVSKKEVLGDSSHIENVNSGELAKVFNENSYDMTTPKLAAFKDGTALAVWIDTKTQDYNDICLYYSYYNGDDWSAPALIDDDGTMDYDPALAVYDNKAYIIWQNVERAVTAEDDLSTIASDTGIKVAEFKTSNEKFSVSELTEEDSFLDMQPTVTADENGVIAGWVKNADNEWFGEGNKNEIWISHYTNGKWDNPNQVVSNSNGIVSLSVGNNGKDDIYAYVLDVDGNAATSEDNELYINKKQITDDTFIQSSVSFVNNVLYWYDNGKIKQITNLTNLDNLEIKDVLREDQGIPTDKYQICDDGNNKSIVFSVANNGYNELYQYKWDSVSGNWSDAITMTDNRDFISGYSAAYINNKLIVLCGITDVKNPEAEVSETEYGTSVVGLLNYDVLPRIDISSVHYNSDEIVPDSGLVVDVELYNNSDKIIEGFNILISDKNGNVKDTIEYNEVLGIGETNTYDFVYRVSENDIGNEYTISAVPANVDKYTKGKPETIDLSYENIAIIDTAWGKYSDEDGAAIIGSVINYGYNAAKNISVELYEIDKDSVDDPSKIEPDKMLIDSYTIENLEPLDIAPISFDVPYIEEGLYFVEIKTDSRDDVMADNSVYYYLTDRDQRIERTLQDIKIILKDDKYVENSQIKKDDITVEAVYSDGLVSDVTSNADIDISSVQMDTIGKYNITVSYGNIKKDTPIHIMTQEDYDKASRGEKVPGYNAEETTETTETQETTEVIETIEPNDSTETIEAVETTENIETTQPQGNQQTQETVPVQDSTTPVEGNIILNPGDTLNGSNGAYTIISDNEKEPSVCYSSSKNIVSREIVVPNYIVIRNKKYKVTEIAPEAFANNSSITSVVIPKNIIKIGRKAFYNCKNLKSIVIKTTKLKKKNVGSKAFTKAGSKKYKKLVVKVPKKKLKAYKKILLKKGLSKKAKIKKNK